MASARVCVQPDVRCSSGSPLVSGGRAAIVRAPPERIATSLPLMGFRSGAHQSGGAFYFRVGRSVGRSVRCGSLGCGGAHKATGRAPNRTKGE